MKTAMNRYSSTLGLAVCLLLGTTAAQAGHPVVETLAETDRTCTTDAGCSVVMTACCSCTLSAVSAGAESAVRKRIVTELACSEVCPISCEEPAVACVARLCEIVPNTPDPDPGTAPEAPKEEEE